MIGGHHRGLLLSLGITQLINQFFVAYMDWGTVLQAILICTFIGVLFGYLPSSRAAKANPIESLAPTSNFFRVMKFRNHHPLFMHASNHLRLCKLTEVFKTGH